MSTSLAEIQRTGGAVVAAPQAPDQAIDMFTERGFTLANRIAKAYASSDAVPAQFRMQVLKKVGKQENWVDNPNAIGNCLVAIEVARAVGMSITAVMQNADMIEGKLRWSGKFVIAAINASGRFTPLRFQMVNRGQIDASYKEKTGWDDEARRPIFTERKVHVENIECIAWALPKGTPEPRLTVEQIKQYPGRMLDLYRDLGWPVIESAPVTMRMVVEEGWYGKPGSKWQTEMRTLMFQYRAGSFFGNIHAPDIVMGMGQTAEEVRDTMQTFDMAADGTVSATPIAELRTTPPPATQFVEPVQQTQAKADVDQDTGEILSTGAQQAAAAASPAPAAQRVPAFDAEAFAEKLAACKDVDTLDLLADEIRGVADADTAQTLSDVYYRRRAELFDAAKPQTAAASQASTAAPASRRRTAPPAGTQSTIE